MARVILFNKHEIVEPVGEGSTRILIDNSRWQFSEFQFHIMRKIRRGRDFMYFLDFGLHVIEANTRAKKRVPGPFTIAYMSKTGVVAVRIGTSKVMGTLQGGDKFSL